MNDGRLRIGEVGEGGDETRECSARFGKGGEDVGRDSRQGGRDQGKEPRGTWVREGVGGSK